MFFFFCLFNYYQNRSSRTEPPELGCVMRSTDDMIESLVCPPPPSEPPVISEEMISGLIVPAPGWSKLQQKKYLFFFKKFALLLYVPIVDV